MDNTVTNQWVRWNQMTKDNDVRICNSAHVVHIMILTNYEHHKQYQSSFTKYQQPLQFQENRDPCGLFAWWKNRCWMHPVTWMWNLIDYKNKMHLWILSQSDFCSWIGKKHNMPSFIFQLPLSLVNLSWKTQVYNNQLLKNLVSTNFLETPLTRRQPVDDRLSTLK